MQWIEALARRTRSYLHAVDSKFYKLNARVLRLLAQASIRFIDQVDGHMQQARCIHNNERNSSEIEGNEAIATHRCRVVGVKRNEVVAKDEHSDCKWPTGVRKDRTKENSVVPE